MNTTDTPADWEPEAALALRIGASFTPACIAANAEAEYMQRLRFWRTLIAFMLGAAEHSVGADGRAAIVECMRNTEACAHVGRGVVQ
jgi:hypothetical protein